MRERGTVPVMGMEPGVSPRSDSAVVWRAGHWVLIAFLGKLSVYTAGVLLAWPSALAVRLAQCTPSAVGATLRFKVKVFNKLFSFRIRESLYHARRSPLAPSP